MSTPVASSAPEAEPAPPGENTSANQVEKWFRRITIVCAIVAAVGILGNVAVLFWGQNEFTQPESVVAIQSAAFAKQGTLYYSLKTYPYTVCAYMPIFYLLDGALIRAGLPQFLAARLISFSAWLVLPFLCWRLALVYTQERYCAWIAALLCCSASLLISWGTVGQVDTLALMFGLAAFERFSLFWVRSQPALLAATFLALAALFTKQTMVACPVAIFFLLWTRNRKIALQFAGGLLGTALAIILLLNGALHGRFLPNVLFANMNPFAWFKILPHLKVMMAACSQLMLIVIAGATQTWRRPGRAVLVYLGFAVLVFLATAPKIGSDTNYQMETMVLLAVGSAVTLKSVDFFRHIFTDSGSWVALLQALLAVHMFLNFRLTPDFLMDRVAKEQLFRQQVAALRPYLKGHQRVLSTELNAMVQTGLPLEVEPLIYTLLVRAGRIDPEPVRQDLSQAKFSTVILYSDAAHPPESSEVPSLPAAQLKEIHQNYDLVAQVPGPYLNGVYVYRARTRIAGSKLSIANEAAP